ncbi:MAG: histidine--tRNA ligase [Zoogloeaceae bacterium]|jgi:histidyl-tRNA synthetase|nr:histidine--tRNA ligase [Zoogloeaceae bacterium]
MSKTKTLQSVKGMNDILPDEAEKWMVLETLFSALAQDYGYRPIRLPVVEPTPLFHRAIGEVTDIVEKEMYSFEDSLNGEALTLRPEGTAGCARAVIQHGLASQTAQRLFYIGPMFRHERPQKGRYRQFQQIGVETFGFSGPDIDVEQILMSARLWDMLNIGDFLTLRLNSLGQPEERARHRADLIAYLEAHRAKLDEEALRRLHSNPLRILDSKNPDVQAVCADAPKLMDYLEKASLAHFDGVRRLLDATGIHYVVDPCLVRGLDYYNLTVFEWVTKKLGAQGTLCAGGRYDGLVAQLGGKPTPACGWACGLERILALIAEVSPFDEEMPGPNLYIVHQGEAACDAAFQQAEALREVGLSVQLNCGGGSFKAQMKKADASGAHCAIIIGDDEVRDEVVQLKFLRDENTPQQRLPATGLGDLLLDYFFNDTDENEEEF